MLEMIPAPLALVNDEQNVYSCIQYFSSLRRSFNSLRVVFTRFLVLRELSSNNERVPSQGTE